MCLDIATLGARRELYINVVYIDIFLCLMLLFTFWIGTETALNGGLRYNCEEVLLEVLHIKTHVNKPFHLLTFHKTLALLIDKRSILQYATILCICQPVSHSVWR